MRPMAIIVILAMLASPLAAEAQQSGLHHVGVVLQGGPYAAAVDGLRDGLSEFGLEYGKDVALDVRDSKGDLNAAEAASQDLERERAELIYALSTSVTLAAKRATRTAPIVFYVGSDPIDFGFVETYRRPG